MPLNVPSVGEPDNFARIESSGMKILLNDEEIKLFIQ